MPLPSADRGLSSACTAGILAISAAGFLLGGLLQPAWSASGTRAQQDPRAHESMRFLVHLDFDLAQQEEYWTDLRLARQVGDVAGVADRVKMERESQALRYAELEQRIEALGGRVESRLLLLPALVVSGLTGEQLQALPRVIQVERDRLVSPASLNVALNAQHHDTKGANQLLDLQGLTIEGTGQVIGLIDTGIDTKMGSLARPHLAFFRDANPAQQIPGGIGGSRILSAVSMSGPFQSIEDLHGHGTRVASIALGFKYNNNPGVSSGAAPDAFVRSYRVDQDNLLGIASVGKMASAIDQAAQAGDIRVLLLAWDGTRNPDSGCNPIIDAVAMAGVTTIMSAGNDGAGSFYHGSFNGLPVGASYLNSQEAYAGPVFNSAVGPMIDGRIYPKLIAVGENLTAAVPDQETTSVGSYGSSGSAAIVAGTAALMLQAAPSLTNRQIRALLIDTAADVGLGNSFASGYGYLRSKAAVQAAQAGAAKEGNFNSLVDYHWPVSLTQGQAFQSTLVWQQRPLHPPKDDLDLVLRDPQGFVVAESRGSQDTVEQVSIVASESGLFTLTLEAVSFRSQSNGIDYAITGVPGMPGSVSSGLCATLAQPTLFSLQQGGLNLPNWNGDKLDTVLKGCNLDQVSAVHLGPTPVNFSVWSAKALKVSVPETTAQGIHVVTLDTPSGPIQGTLSIANTPLLTGPYTIPGYPLELEYKPGAPFAFLASLNQSPTIIPGFVNLAIGNAGNELVIMKIGSLNLQGEYHQYVPYSAAALASLVGVKVYFQAALVEPGFPGIPLLTSNVAVALIAN